MSVKLIRVSKDDAEILYKMQKEAFTELLERYHDYDTNPANEPLSKTVFKLEQSETYFYFISVKNKLVGAIRVVDRGDETPKRISPLFILPDFRRKGYAKEAIVRAEEIHGSDNWELYTILQEKGNCHLYEKMGYRQTGKKIEVNNKLTLVLYKKQ